MARFLDSLRDYLSHLPHNWDALHRLYEHLASTPPAFAILAFITLLLAIVALKHFWRLAVYLAVGGLFLSFLIFAPGRAVMRQAWHLPLAQRPVCLADAVYHGAVWSHTRLKDAKSCRVKATPHPGFKPDQTDSGADGVLNGSVSSSDWSAHISAPAPTASWQALTHMYIGDQYVYLIGPYRSWRVSACPKLTPVPEQYLTDKSGEVYPDFFAEHVPTSALPLLAPTAHKLVYDKGHLHRYRFLSARGKVVGYLMPASGEEGNCVAISGPYVHSGKSFRFSASSISSASFAELGFLTDGLTASRLRKF